MVEKGPRFGLQADQYRRLRPGYPDAVWDTIASAAGERRSLAVDLGAGSGQATARLLELFDRVIAVEPDTDMAALIPPDPRLEVRVAWAEKASFADSVDAMIAATAFHWMDAARVCAMASKSLCEGAPFVPFGYGPFRLVSPDASARLGETEYAFWRAWMDPRLIRWRPYADIVRDTGLASSIEPFEHVFDQTFEAKDAAGLLLTTSYASAINRERPGYAREFTRRVVESAAGEPIVVRFELMGCVARF